MRRALLAAAALVLFQANAAVAAPAPSGAAGNGEWSVGPAAAKGVATPRRFFSLQADPGAHLTDAVRITNLTGARESFTLYGADAYNTPRDGGFALRTQTQRNTDVGSWIKLRRTSVTVPAHKYVDVRLTIDVPVNATPGQHIGGVVAMSNAIEGLTTTSGGVRVGLQRAVGARVYLQVAGPITPGLRPADLAVARSTPLVPFTGASHATLTYSVANTGNIALAPTAHVWITGLFGRTLADFPARTLPEILPGQHTELTVPWHGLPAMDAVTVHVELTAPGTARTSTQTQFFVVPWIALGALVAAALFAWFGLPVLIRRWRRKAGLDADREEALL